LKWFHKEISDLIWLRNWLWYWNH